MTDTRVFTIDCKNPQASLVERAAALLSEGRLVVAPTETRYGLLARADDAAAVERLYAVKGRRPEAPLAMFVDGIAGLEQYGEMTPVSRRLAERFLPGPLTLVLTAKRETELPVVQDGRIGLRVSSSSVIAAILARVAYPLTATSANLSGAGETETLEEIVDAFGDRVALYLDGGRLEGPVSTVLLCEEERTEILREGALARAEIERVLERRP